jgi:O-antigen/teichoic acid export membrane protein
MGIVREHRGGRGLAHARNLIWVASQRLSWGVADQAMSSVTNFSVNIYIARALGAVQYGAFGLAFVTYSFALNASRGLATDPLLVRYASPPIAVWRRAVAKSTGTALAVGVVMGFVVLVVALCVHGPLAMAFYALAITMPGLLLQDSWRFAFFARGRGAGAFVNDTIWAVVLIPGLLLLRRSGHPDVFWAVLIWGASAAVGALVGPIQTRVIPRLSGIRDWLREHRDLGLRYLLEGTANSGSTQLRNYGIGLIVGLAAVGYVQAVSTLMGPFMVVFFGMALVTTPEAARLLKRSPRRMVLFCVGVSGGLTVSGLVWGLVVLIGLPRGLGHLMLGRIWEPTYPLVLPFTFAVMGWCAAAGATAGLHALGAAKRSLRAMLIASGLYVVFSVAGAVIDGDFGSVIGAAIATWIGVLAFWWELRAGLHAHLAEQADPADEVATVGQTRAPGSHRKPRRRVLTL